MLTPAFLCRFQWSNYEQESKQKQLEIQMCPIYTFWFGTAAKKRNHRRLSRDRLWVTKTHLSLTVSFANEMTVKLHSTVHLVSKHTKKLLITNKVSLVILYSAPSSTTPISRTSVRFGCSWLWFCLLLFSMDSMTQRALVINHALSTSAQFLRQLNAFSPCPQGVIFHSLVNKVHHHSRLAHCHQIHLVLSISNE